MHNALKIRSASLKLRAHTSLYRVRCTHDTHVTSSLYDHVASSLYVYDQTIQVDDIHAVWYVSQILYVLEIATVQYKA